MLVAAGACGKTKIAAGIVCGTGQGDADRAVAELAVLDHKALPHWIELAVHHDLIEDEAGQPARPASST